MAPKGYCYIGGWLLINRLQSWNDYIWTGSFKGRVIGGCIDMACAYMRVYWKVCIHEGGKVCIHEGGKVCIHEGGKVCIHEGGKVCMY